MTAQQVVGLVLMGVGAAAFVFVGVSLRTAAKAAARDREQAMVARDEAIGMLQDAQALYRRASETAGQAIEIAGAAGTNDPDDRQVGWTD